MKVLTRILLVTGLAFLAMGTASATGYEFYAKYQCSDKGGDGSGFLIEARQSDVNGLDSESLVYLDPSHPHAVAAIYKTNGIDGWDGNNGYYGNDDRHWISAGQTMVFDNIYFWAAPGTAIGDMYFWLMSSGHAIFDPGLTYTLDLVSTPSGISYNGPTQWTMYSGHTPHDIITLPYYSTTDPSTGYKFRAVVTAVPEPSSAVGLLGSFVGLATTVVMRRRRK